MKIPLVWLRRFRSLGYFFIVLSCLLFCGPIVNFRSMAIGALCLPLGVFFAFTAHFLYELEASDYRSSRPVSESSDSEPI